MGLLTVVVAIMMSHAAAAFPKAFRLSPTFSHLKALELTHPPILYRTEGSTSPGSQETAKFRFNDWHTFKDAINLIETQLDSSGCDILSHKKGAWLYRWNNTDGMIQVADKAGKPTIYIDEHRVRGRWEISWHSPR